MSRYPGAVWMPLTGHDGGPMAHPPLGLVLHVAEGNGSLHDYFQRSVHPNRKSSTWWCGKSGRLEQYLDSQTVPWSQGDGNATYASVETEGYATEPLTDAQVITLAHLYAWGAQVHGWPYAAVDTPGQRGLILHSDGGAAWGGHACPGPIRAAQRADILSLTPPSPPVQEDDDMPGLIAQATGDTRVYLVNPAIGTKIYCPTQAVINWYVFLGAKAQQPGNKPFGGQDAAVMASLHDLTPAAK